MYSVDEIGNCSELLKIANPFYVEPVEETPAPTPDSGEPTHDAHCPADCDCRKQSAASNGSASGGGSSASTSSGSTAAKSTATKASKPQDTAAASEPVSIEKGTGFTENGSAVTRDLLYDKHTNKQFITVETRNGHTLYLVIDYDKPLDEDGEQYETYFLNLVDESDLLALLDEEDTVPVCTCKDKCEAGAVNTSCEVCKNNMTECMGKEAEPVTEPEVTPEPEPEPAKKSGSGLVVIVLLLALAGGGALYWFKLRKPKADTKGPADLDNYDFGEADDDTEYETEEDESDAPSDSVDD